MRAGNKDLPRTMSGDALTGDRNHPDIYLTWDLIRLAWECQLVVRAYPRSYLYSGYASLVIPPFILSLTITLKCHILVRLGLCSGQRFDVSICDGIQRVDNVIIEMSPIEIHICIDYM